MTQSRSDEVEVTVQDITTPSRLMHGDFGAALHVLKAGRKVARRGWNGKDMYLFIPTSWYLQFPGISSDAFEMRPFIAMKDAQDKIVMGWLASQTDMLAEDWFEVV